MRSARWAGLFLAAASAAGAAWAQAENTIYLRPGDQGVIVYTLSNDQPTYGSIEGARIFAGLPDGYTLDAESVLGPISIDPGAQGRLWAVVNPDPQAEDGIHDGVIVATATTELLPALPEVPIRFVLDSVPPQIKVFDPNGAELADGSPVGFSSVTVTALDDVSGVSTITIEGYDAVAYPQETHEATTHAEGLSNHTYLVTATDWSGNVSTRTFTVSLPQPRLALLWGAHAGFMIADSTPPGGGFPFVNPTLGTGIQVEFEPHASGAGAASMQVFAYDANGQPQEIGSNTDAFAGSHVYSASDEGLGVLSQLPVGQVTFFGRDSLGLEASITVNVTTTALIVVADGQVLARGQFTGSRRLELFAIPGSTAVALSGSGGDFRVGVTTTVGFVQGEFDRVPEGAYAAAALDDVEVQIASQAVSVDLTPPSVIMTVPGTSDMIADAGFTNSRSVNIEADDSGAGVRKITVTGFDPVVFSTEPPIIGMTVSSAVAILEDLDDGVYLVQAEDDVGNVRMTTFTVETGPSLSVFGAGPVPLYDDWRSTAPPAVIPSDVLWGNFTSFPDGASPEQLMFPDAISFHAGDPAGLASVAVAGARFRVTAVYINGQLSNPAVDPGNLPPGTTEIAGAFDVSAAGRYEVSVTRPDGVRSIAPFDIVAMSASNEKDRTYALYDVDAKSFLSGKLALQLSASAGIATVSADHNDNGASIPVSNDHGHSVALGEAEFANSLGIRVFFDDTRGNSWSYVASFLDGLPTTPASYSLDPFDPSLSDAVLISSYPGLPPFPWRAGVYNTSTFDIYDSSALPGGALVQEPSPTGGSLTPILVGGITPFAEHVSAPLALSTITVGHINVTLHTTGGAIAGADGATVYDGFVYFSTFPAESEFPPTGGGAVSADPGLPEALQLARAWSLTITIKDMALDRIPINLCAAPDTTTMQCHDGTILAVTASRGGGPRVKAMPFKGFESGFVKTLVPAGLSGGSLDLGTGITVSNLNTYAAGVFVSGVSYRPPDPGYRALPLNQAFNVTPSGGFLRTPFTVTLDFDGSGLSAAQRQQLRLVRILNGLMSDDLPFASNGDNEVSFQTATGGYFMLLTTLFPDPVKFVDGGMSIVYSQSGVGGAGITSQSGDPLTEPLKSLLAQALALGQAPVGPLTELLPENTPLNPQAILRVRFDQTQRERQGMADSAVRLLELSNGVPKPATLPNAYFAYETPQMSARLAGIHSFYGVFGSTTPRYIDSQPPVTSVSFGPPVTYDASGGVTLTTASPIALSAVDLQDGNIPPSGVATTYFLVDQAFQDFQTTPPQVYMSTFSLPAGAHTLRYFSADHAGNVEAPKSKSVTVSGPSQGGTGGSGGSGGSNGPQKGLAIAADAGGKLWEVGSDSGRLWLGRYGPAGLEARVQLPGAVEDGAWSLRFDASGNVYAIGTAGAATEELAVYAVSSAGVLLSSAGFQAAGGAQAVAWDASGELWITGALQQGTPEDGSLSLTMGLWKFTPASGLLALTTTYTRGGPADAGFGVRALDGNVYVSGYSSTQPLSTPSLDLALWKFDAQGHGPLAGPFLERGYLRSLSAPPIARLEATAGTLYTAAMRSSGPGLTDLGLVRYDSAGQSLSDHFVTVDGYSLTPRAITLDAQGNIAVGVDAESAEGAVHGVARFAPDGGLASFLADSASTAAISGLAALGGDLWLAVDGSTVPIRFRGDRAIAATDVLVSSRPAGPAPLPLAISPFHAAAAGSVPVSVSGAYFETGDGLALERFAIGQSSWAAAGSVSVGRRDGRTVRLRDGRVLLIGGDVGGSVGATATVDAFDPATGQWSAMAPMSYARFGHTATLLQDGRVLVTGGFSGTGATYLDSAEVYDPALNAWSAAGRLSRARTEHAAALLPGGKVLLAGGFNNGTLADVDLFDPVSGTMTAGPAMSTPRVYEILQSLGNGKVLAAGGGVNASSELYDPASNSWTPTGAMIQGRNLAPWVTLPDGRVLTAGGETSRGTTASAEVYDPVSGAWEALPALGQATYGSGLVIAGGAPLLLGGVTGASAMTARAEYFDGSAWRPAPAMTVPRATVQPTTLLDGRVLIAAGWDSFSTRLSGAEILDGPRARVEAAGVSEADATRLLGLLPLDGASTGYWDVVVAGGGGRVGRLAGGFEVLPGPPADSLPPRTYLSVSAPSFSSTTLFSAGGTIFSLEAFDDYAVVGDTQGVGVAQTFLAVDTATFSLYSGSFTITSEGNHTVAYYSVDSAGHTETVQVRSVAVDLTSPVTTLAVQSASVTLAGGVLTANAPAKLILSAADGGSGVAGTFYSIDAATDGPRQYLGPAALAEGTHTITFYSQDNVGNLESVVTASVTVVSPPVPLELLAVVPSSAPAAGSVTAAVSGRGFTASASLALERLFIGRSSWSAAGSLSPARRDGRTVRLRDGRVLVIGGDTGGVVGASAAVDVFDPATGQWSAAAPMASARFGQTATLLQDGRVLVTGGFSGTGSTYLDSAEIYDPASNVWAPAGHLSRARTEHSAALLPDGKVLIAGGFNAGTVADVDLYDPASGAMSAGPPMSTPRVYGILQLLGNGKVLAAGGGVNSTSELYDPATNSWAPTGPMVQARNLAPWVILADGRVLTAGGQGAGGITASAEAYDPETGAWSALPALGQKRYQHGLIVTGGVPLVVGGSVDGTSMLASSEYFDGSAWRPGPAMSALRGDAEPTMLADGRVLVAGGYDSPSTRLADAEILDGPRARIAASAVAVSDSGHLRATLPLDAAATGYWDVSAAQAGQADRLAGGFLVLPAPPSVAATTQTTNGSPTLELTSQVPGVSITEVSTASASGAIALGTAGGQGLQLASDVFAIDPSTAFSPQAQLVFRFDPAVITDTSTLAVYRFDGVNWSSAGVIASQSVTLSADSYVTAYLAHSSLYALFVKPSDLLAPRTTLSVGAPRFASASEVFISSATPLSLSAIDDKRAVGDGLGVGVARTMVAIDSAAFSVYAGTFTLSVEGDHAVRYYSVDLAGNAEVLRVSSLTVDATAPASTATPGAPSFKAEDGALFVSSTTPLALTAIDSGPAPSGVARVEYSVDGGTFAVYASSLTFAEGPHRLAYRAVDNLDLTEATKTLAVQSDATPPATTLQPSGTFYVSGGQAFAPASFTYALAAEDFVSSGVPAGVALTRYALDGGAFTVAAGTFSLSQGVRKVAFYSADNVGNAELVKSATIYVDVAPPVSALAVGSPSFDAGGGRVFVSSATPLSLSAQDLVVGGVASGVEYIAFRRGGDAFAPYASAFTLTGADGAQEVDWLAADHVGNVESTRTATFLFDDTAPQSSLALLGGRRFPGPDGQTVYASSDTRIALLASDPPVGGSAAGVALTLWQDNSGSTQAYSAPLSLAEGAHAVAYRSQDNVANLEVLRTTNVWVDATPPASAFAFGAPYHQASDGTNYVTPATPLTLSAADPSLPSGQPGSGVARVEYSLDGAPFTQYAGPLTLAEGRHTLLYRGVDNVGNVEAARALALQSDATPPASTLVIGQPQYPLPGGLLVSSRTAFSITAADPVANNVASGVKDTYYRVSDVSPSSAAFAAFTTPFTTSGLDATKVIQFYSRDNVLNTEAVKSSSVLLDATPPEVALLSPAGCAAGICRVLKGRFPVLGTARDAHLARYVLEAAAGRDATSGFALVSSGTLAVSSGTLGVWDAGKLSGWQTLRLTAADLVQNISVLNLDVWVGDPAALMTLGNHDTFNMPTGVAVSSSGAIYVADRGADRVAIFSSTGALLAAFGGPGHDSDDHRVSSATLRLHEPAGVAVDADGDVFVADTEDSRVLKLSPTGQVLLSLGDKPGPDPGRFQRPFGVAVDSAGSIYVADTGNHRVQVFSSSGVFVAQFALSVVPRTQVDSDHGEDADDAGLGRPVAIALDASGRVYLADPAGHRALIYTSTGALVKTLPIAGDRPDHPGTPDGVAVSPSGDCLLVSDKKLDRVLKFDFTGAENLAFGEKRKAGDKKAPSAIVFRKPAGLALDAAGNLYVADRNNESIKKFGLPDGRPTLVVPPPAPGDDLAAKDVVDHDAGGTVAREDKAAVAIPPQALPQDLKITVAPPAPGPDDNSRRLAQQDNQLKVASPPVDFGPEGTKFAVPATLTIPYDPQLVAAQGVVENDLKINYWNPAKRQWEAFDSTVDKANHTVTAKTSHFSLYQVLSSTPSQIGAAGGPAADPTFMVHAVYAFPNPAVRGAKPTIHVAVGVADEVKITILNVAGQEVAHGAMYGTPAVIDDGNGPQYAYEWVWDGHIASGMYFYVVEASKSGYPKIRKAGKLGVVR